MAKADREPILMYRVWHPINESPDDAREYGALDTQRAAQIHAEYCYRHREGWEEPFEDLRWPVTFHVVDPHDGQTYAVDVALDMQPVFRAGTPVKLR